MPASLALNMNFTAPVKAPSPQPAAANPAAPKNQPPKNEASEAPKSAPASPANTQESNASKAAETAGNDGTAAQEGSKTGNFADLLKKLGLNQSEEDTALPLVGKDDASSEESSTTPLDLTQLLAVLPPPTPPTPVEVKPAATDSSASAGIGGVGGKSGSELPLQELGAGKAAKNAGNFEEMLASQETLLESQSLKVGHSGDQAAAVQNHAQTQPAQRTETPTSSHLATPVRSPDWSNDFSQKVVWLANNDKQTAQLTLNPPQLGPIEITLEINKDSTNALFAVTNPETRQAIESALPQLREAFASAGLELGQANVSADNPRQQQDARPEGGAPRIAGSDGILPGESASDAQSLATPLRRGLGMVDTFA